MLSSLNLGVKPQKYFVSSSDKFVDEKTLLKTWSKRDHYNRL